MGEWYLNTCRQADQQYSSTFSPPLFQNITLLSSESTHHSIQVGLMKRNVNPNNEESKSKLTEEIIAYVLFHLTSSSRD
jgi:hypothetical protein